MKVGDFLVRHTDKWKRFEFLINKADTALEMDFCIEASSIYYALIEERFHSMFDLIGVPINKRQQKVYHCIQRLLNIIDNGHYVESISQNSSENKLYSNIRNLIIQEFNRNLLIEIDSWRQNRNSITHDFAKVDMDYNDILNYEKKEKTFK